jgi:hypothetical protein
MTMKKLTNLKEIKVNGSLTQVAKLPLTEPDEYYSDWIAYNGNAEDYEIRFRLSVYTADKLSLR